MVDRPNIVTEIPGCATDGTHYDPRKSFSAADTDESFDLHEQMENP